MITRILKSASGVSRRAQGAYVSKHILPASSEIDTVPQGKLPYQHAGISTKTPLNSDTESAASATGPTPLSTRGPYVARLTSRALIRFDGPDTINFLQGLVTNDMRLLEESAPPPSDSPVPTPNMPTVELPVVYSAILSPQGRFLFDLFFYRPSQGSGTDGAVLSGKGKGPTELSNDDRKTLPGLVADVDAETRDELLATLKKHRLRANVNFEDASSSFAAWVHFAGKSQEGPSVETSEESGGVGWQGTHDYMGKSSATATDNGWHWRKDPRLAELGMRGVFKAGSIPPLMEAGDEVGEEYYKLWRYEHGVGEGSTEIPTGEALPLEYNLDALHGISYDKGCYVGQELTARTHHRGVIRKRLMPCQFVSPHADGQDGQEMQKAAVPGSEVVEESKHKKVGQVTAALGPRGLVHLRLQDALNEKAVLSIPDNDGAVVKPIRPKWWPTEWGREEETAPSA
eukprot:TRINITY_DN5629_c0_g1_i1.p1 TRINITY_DN5629_c0_g1~~TRINITY_DN5629_c0_g1_i1.p1  ORF type:complete len:458 (+),score=62.42 TRINITY_DN5629_c0_g1_i1:221-1594(+)